MSMINPHEPVNPIAENTDGESSGLTTSEIVLQAVERTLSGSETQPLESSQPAVERHPEMRDQIAEAYGADPRRRLSPPVEEPQNEPSVQLEVEIADAADSTRNVIDTTQEAGDSTQEVVESSHDVSDSTQDPVDSTQEVGESTQEAIESSQDVGEATQDVGETAELENTDIVDTTKEVTDTADLADKDPQPPTGFRALPLSDEVQGAVQRAGYDTPTDIQAEIIPHMLDGRDVVAQSQTGTGKTAGFALPILSRLDKNQRKPQVLVLTPTRELAIQVAGSFSTYASGLKGFSVAAIYGGADYNTQFRQLKRGVQVVVGTPGRTIDHINRGTLDLSEIQCLVLDEADEMLNMGFLADVQFVLEKTPDGRQVALFSATLPAPIRSIAQQYLNDPAKITIKTKTMTADCIRQRAVMVHPREKIDVLSRFLEAENTDGVIVFTKTREATVTVADQLTRLGLKAIALNGDMPQKTRERTIQQLKSGNLDILVATDVAARGLDVTRVSHVFNFDMPHDSESYVHRIGRTGRAGRTGEAIIFLTGSQRGRLRMIERVTRQQIQIVPPPTIEQINDNRVVQFKQSIADTVATGDLSMFEKMLTRFADKSGIPVEKIAAALAVMGQGGQPFFKEDRPAVKPYDGKRNDGKGNGGGRFERGRSGKGSRPTFGGKGESRPSARVLGPPEPGMTRYRIAVGANDGVKPGNIVGAVANEGGIDGNDIGAISIHDSFSTVDLPKNLTPDVQQTLSQTRVAGRKLQLRVAGNESLKPESGAKKPAFSAKPAYGKPTGGKTGGQTGGKPTGKKPYGEKQFVRASGPQGAKHKKRKPKAK